MRQEIFEAWRLKIEGVLIEKGEIPITILSSHLKTSLATTQKYINLLELKKIINTRVEGRNRLISINIKKNVHR